MTIDAIIARAIAGYAKQSRFSVMTKAEWEAGVAQAVRAALDKAGQVIVSNSELARIKAAMPETVTIKVSTPDAKKTARGAAIHRRLMGKP